MPTFARPICSGIVQEWLAEPSVLFDLLVKADRKRGTRSSNRYYELAMRLAHVTAATDLVPSLDEVQAIDAYRTLLLQAMDAAGVARPGQPDARDPSRLLPRLRLDPRPQQPPRLSPEASHVDAPPARSVTEVMAELDALIGLENVKAEVRRLTSMLQVQQIRAERGLPVIEVSHHLVFTGNPGTGKTTVARLLSQIYRAIGVVSKGQLVETDRSKLVAGFVGQTALKTLETLQAALGGMLLIDEAYALARGGDNDFGREAIDTLVKFMEDHRDDLAIVAAGYTEEMADFIDANPGLKSRFTRTISFPDYTDDELVSIFLALGEKSQYALQRRRARACAPLRQRRAAHPRLRQRPLRAQPVRDCDCPSGAARRAAQRPERRAADHADRRRHRRRRCLTSMLTSGYPFGHDGRTRRNRRGRSGSGRSGASASPTTRRATHRDRSVRAQRTVASIRQRRPERAAALQRDRQGDGARTTSNEHGVDHPERAARRRGVLADRQARRRSWTARSAVSTAPSCRLAWTHPPTTPPAPRCRPSSMRPSEFVRHATTPTDNCGC